MRAFELRVTSVSLDPVAQRFVRDSAHGPVRILADVPDFAGAVEYRQKIEHARKIHNIPDSGTILVVEVTVSDPSDFETALTVTGHEPHGYRTLHLVGPSVPNAIAALLLHLRSATSVPPHVYFEWSEGNPLVNLLRYLIFGLARWPR
jgi:hypothetical protein